MRFTEGILVAASIGAVMAGPAHRHRHRNVHEKREVDWAALNWNNLGIDWSSAWAAGQHTSTTAAAPVATHSASPIIAAAVPTTTSVAPVAAATTAAASTKAASIISEATTLFSDIVGLANSLSEFGTATESSGSVVGKIGNIGSPEGSNMILVDSTKGYQFTNTFENTSGESMTIVVWNKAATSSSGTVEANLGSCIAMTSPALSFTLAAGAKQIVAFQEDSQVGWAQPNGKTTASGAIDSTWGEANFVSTGCGYDVSSIVNSKGNTYNMAISSLETTCISDPTQNDWIAVNGNPEDPAPVGDSDGSCYIPGSTATLTTKMGGDM